MTEAVAACGCERLLRLPLFRLNLETAHRLGLLALQGDFPWSLTPKRKTSGRLDA